MHAGAAYGGAVETVMTPCEVLAEELAPRSIRVNVVLPSAMDTAANRASTPPATLQAAVPPEDVAAVVAFLCSDVARAVTGAVVPVYGHG